MISATVPCYLFWRHPNRTNHLDAESVAWLEQFLAQYQGTCVAITHDRYFLDNVAGWILELDQGKGIPYEGNYQTFLDKKADRFKQEKKENSARAKELAKELEWIREFSFNLALKPESLSPASLSIKFKLLNI